MTEINNSDDIFIKPTKEEEKPTKEDITRKKQKKPMTEEIKKALLENLKKGREKYKRLALEKREKKKEDEEHINYNPKADIDELKETLKQLKEMLNKTKKEEKIEEKTEKKIEEITHKPKEEKPKKFNIVKPIEVKPSEPINIIKPKERVIYSLFKTTNW